MDVKTMAEQLVAHRQAGTIRQWLTGLCDSEALCGVEAIEGKHDWWESALEVYSAHPRRPLHQRRRVLGDLRVRCD